MGPDNVGQSIDSAMVAGPRRSFVAGPTGEVLGRMARLAGSERLVSTVEGDPMMPATPGGPVPVLQTVASALNGNRTYLS